MSDRDQEWAAYRAWNKDFRGPIYFQNWDQWIAEYGFAVWQASRRAALEEAACIVDIAVTPDGWSNNHIAEAIRALAGATDAN